MYHKKISKYPILIFKYIDSLNDPTNYQKETFNFPSTPSLLLNHFYTPLILKFKKKISDRKKRKTNLNGKIQIAKWHSEEPKWNNMISLHIIHQKQFIPHFSLVGALPPSTNVGARQNTEWNEENNETRQMVHFFIVEICCFYTCKMMVAMEEHQQTGAFLVPQCHRKIYYLPISLAENASLPFLFHAFHTFFH